MFQLQHLCSAATPYSMYYQPNGMKVRGIPVQTSKPYSKFDPTQDSRPFTKSTLCLPMTINIFDQWVSLICGIDGNVGIRRVLTQTYVICRRSDLLLISSFQSIKLSHDAKAWILCDGTSVLSWFVAVVCGNVHTVGPVARLPLPLAAWLPPPVKPPIHVTYGPTWQSAFDPRRMCPPSSDRSRVSGRNM